MTADDMDTSEGIAHRIGSHLLEVIFGPFSDMIT